MHIATDSAACEPSVPLSSSAALAATARLAVVIYFIFIITEISTGRIRATVAAGAYTQLGTM